MKETIKTTSEPLSSRAKKTYIYTCSLITATTYKDKLPIRLAAKLLKY